MPNKIHSVNLDAGETAFFARELEHVQSKAYDIKYPELKARKLFPMSSEAGPGAESITYEQYDQVGMAKIISNYADDLPRADVKGKQFTSLVKSLGISYGYNIQEIRNAKMAGKPLEQRKANAAKRGSMQKENQLAFFGDSAAGIPGFINASNINSYTIPAGASTQTQWSTKTADEILADMNGVANMAFTVSKGVETSDTMLLPLEQYMLISTKRIGAANEKTVMQFFLETNPFIKAIEWVNELDNVSGSDVIMCYRRDPDALLMHVPQDFEQFPAQERGLEFLVPCHHRAAGVIVYYPLSITKGTGI